MADRDYASPNVSEIALHYWAERQKHAAATLPTDSDGSGGGGDMEARLRKVEDRVIGIEKDIAVIKGDIAHIKTDQGKLDTSVRDVRTALWAVLAILGALIVGGFAIVMTYLLEIIKTLPS